MDNFEWPPATTHSIHLYSAHRAVIFAIAQLSCLSWFPIIRRLLLTSESLSVSLSCRHSFLGSSCSCRPAQERVQPGTVSRRTEEYEYRPIRRAEYRSFVDINKRPRCRTTRRAYSCREHEVQQSADMVSRCQTTPSTTMLVTLSTPGQDGGGR